MFTTVLIANRGEIACRAIRTLKRLGVKSVAVYSDADRNAQHVKQVDIAIALGGDKASDSYLRIDKILAQRPERLRRYVDRVCTASAELTSKNLMHNRFGGSVR